MERKENPFEEILNVHTFNRTTKPNMRQRKNERLWARERAEKGYCEYDLMDMDVWFLAIIPAMLREFRDHHQGFPFELMEQEYLENRDQYPLIHSPEELKYWGVDDEKDKQLEAVQNNAALRWKAILTDMADRFESMYRLYDFGDSDLSHEEQEQQLHKSADEAFDLLKKWFFHLWY